MNPATAVAISSAETCTENKSAKDVVVDNDTWLIVAIGLFYLLFLSALRAVALTDIE